MKNSPDLQKPSKITRRKFLAGMAGLAVSPTLNKVSDVSEKVAKITESVFEKESKQKQREKIAEQTRSYLLALVGSHNYLRKLSYGLNGDMEKAKMEQSRRIDALKNVIIYPYEARDSRHLEALFSDGFIKLINQNKYAKERIKKTAREKGISEKDVIKDIKKVWKMSLEKFKLGEIRGIFLYDRVIIDADLTDYQFIEAVMHELLHSIVQGDYFILDSTKEKLNKTFAGMEGDLTLEEKEDMEYLKNLAERLVRKQHLEIKLEKLGIKKYGEPFTMEHYDKMWEAVRSGQIRFDSDVMEFIMSTEDARKTKQENFKTFKELFDTIADVGVANKDEVIG